MNKEILFKDKYVIVSKSQYLTIIWTKSLRFHPADTAKAGFACRSCILD